MIQIIRAEQQDIEQLVSLFANGFMADPLYCHFIPYEKERGELLRQIFRKYLTDFWGELTVFSTLDRKAALCICPGDANGEERVILPASTQKIYDCINQTAASEFYEDYLTLDLLAVDPSLQGKGVGKALVQAFCNLVKTTGKKGVVEIYQPENLAFYQKCGFRLSHIQPVGETLLAYLLEWEEV